LTPREREVLALVTSGRQQKQIAAELGIGLTTTRFHVKSIMEKMAAGSLADLVRKAQTLGIRNKS
jgi:FixJ family two-component response regulator